MSGIHERTVVTRSAEAIVVHTRFAPNLSRLDPNKNIDLKGASQGRNDYLRNGVS